MARPGPGHTSPNQGGLFPEESIPDAGGVIGPVERAVRASIAYQTATGVMDSADEGAGEVGAKLACHMDRAGGTGGAYRLAKLGPVMLDWLDRMYMNPASRRDTDNDDAARFQDLLSELSSPVSDSDADADTPVSHAQDSGT